MKSFFASTIKDHFKRRYDVIDAFEHRYCAMDMILNCTVFIEHRGMAISGTTSFFEGQMISYEQVIEDIEAEIEEKKDAWDALLDSKEEMETLSEIEKHPLVWLAREMALAADTLGISQLCSDWAGFDASAETLMKLYGYNLKTPEETYKAVIKTLAIGNDELIALLRGGYELPEEFRI